MTHATGAHVAADEKSPKKANAAAKTKKVPLKVSAVRTVSPEDSAADKKSLGQVRKTFAFLGFVAIAYAAYLVFSGQVDEFVTSLAGVDLAWIVAGVICFLFYYVFGVVAYALSIIADPDNPVGIRDLMSVEASGVFFMRLTPNSAGAPPAQIYRLTRAGLSVGEASALNFTRTVLYEAGEGVFAAIMLVFCGGYFYETFGDVTLIGIFLFGFKVVQVGAMLFLCLFPKPVVAIGNWALRFANRRGWLKDEKYEQWYEMVNTQVVKFSAAFKRSAKNVREMLMTMAGDAAAARLHVRAPVVRAALLWRAGGLPDLPGLGLDARAADQRGPAAGRARAVPRSALRSSSRACTASTPRRALSSGVRWSTCCRSSSPRRAWACAPRAVRASTSAGSASASASRGSSPGGAPASARAARGGVTVKPKAKKVVVSGSGAKAGESDVQARIAAGKAAAAAKKETAEKDDAAE